MSRVAWRRATRPDIEGLVRFLSEAEEGRAGFSGRIIRDGEARLPSPLRGAVWIATEPDDPGLRGALLCHPSRLAFPILPEDPASDRLLALSSGSWRPAQAIGLERDVARYGAALGLEARASVDYRLMARRPPPGAALPGRPPLPRGVSARRALPSDLDALLPLQEAYEREEVLTPIHCFDAAACRASLARALDRQLVFLAEEGGTVVAKAGTNARGLRVDQVGGVYTLPERRGRGIAAALMGALLGEIEGGGRRASLFVKPGNAPARSLYRRLGFEELDGFRADYFEA